MPTPNTAEPSGQDGNSPLFDVLFKNVEQPPAQQEERRPGRSLSGVLAEIDAEKDKPAKPAEKDKPAEGAPAEKKTDKPAEGAATPPPAEKPVKVTKKKALPEPLPEPEVEEEIIPEPPKTRAAKAPEPEPEKEQELELNDEERDTLDIAKFAESVDPKYKGYSGKLEKFYRAHAQWVAKKRAEDPEFEFSEDNPEYSTWLTANRPPQIPAFEMRRLDRARVKQEAESAAEAKVNTIREELRRRDEEPKIREKANRFMGDAFRESMPEEMAAVFKEKGIAGAKAEFPFEYNLVAEVSKQASDMVAEFLALTSGIKKFNQDMNTDEGKMHDSIIKWIDHECSDFAANGGQYRIRDGKTFLDRSRFHSLPAAQRAKYWTFSNDEMVMIAQGSVKRAVAAQIKQQREQLEAMGYVRQPRKPDAAETQKPVEPPKPTPAQVRGSQAPGAAPAANTNEAPNPVMNLLGMG